MSPRADEHEGDLNDTETKRRHDRAEARAVQILQHDALELTESGTFLRWFSKYAYPMLVQNFPVNNGSMLAHFMGKRELVLQIVDEMNLYAPGFMQRMLSARADYEHQLEQAANGPQKGN